MTRYYNCQDIKPCLVKNDKSELEQEVPLAIESLQKAWKKEGDYLTAYLHAALMWNDGTKSMDLLWLMQIFVIKQTMGN